MAITLSNCTMYNNTAVVIRVVPDAPGNAFNIPAGGNMPSGNIVFDTIHVSGDVLVVARSMRNLQRCRPMRMRAVHRYKMNQTWTAGVKPS